MLKNLDLQTVILFLFGILIIVAVFVFSGIIPSLTGGEENEVEEGQVVIWGTIPKDLFTSAFKELLDKTFNNSDVVKYVGHSADSFYGSLIEALASGSGPDMVLLPESSIALLEEKIEPLSYENYGEREYVSNFIEGAEIYLRPEGILALPFSVDPIVLYWNRDIFSTNGVVRPPLYWDELLTLAPVLTKRNTENAVLKSAVAFGEYTNVAHAKDILALLLIQTGNKIAVRGGKDGDIVSVLNSGESKEKAAASEVFSFYTDFADPGRSVYSWNRSLPQSKDAFLSQDLAIYFGFASEAKDIAAKNPNLNFGIASAPQIRDYPFRRGFGHMNAVAVMKVSGVKTLAAQVGAVLSSPDGVRSYVKHSGLPPVRRDLLEKKPTGAAESVFADAAIIASSWLDPDPKETDAIFRSAVDSILAGTFDSLGAVQKLDSELTLLGSKR